MKSPSNFTFGFNTLTFWGLSIFGWGLWVFDVCVVSGRGVAHDRICLKMRRADALALFYMFGVNRATGVPIDFRFYAVFGIFKNRLDFSRLKI